MVRVLEKATVVVIFGSQATCQIPSKGPGSRSLSLCESWEALGVQKTAGRKTVTQAVTWDHLGIFQKGNTQWSNGEVDGGKVDFLDFAIYLVQDQTFVGVILDGLAWVQSRRFRLSDPDHFLMIGA